MGIVMGIVMRTVTLFMRIWQALRPRLKTPTVLQMEAVECGAASLAMILAYHKKFVAVEALRIACGVSRDGSKAINVVRAARQYGLNARGFKAEPAALRRLPMPLIAFWNFNHFLVVEDIGRGKVYLNDPASGRRVVSDEEFDRSFTGVVLAFEKGPGFEPGGRPRNVWRSLKTRLAGANSAVLYLLLLGVCLVIPGLVIPVFARIFIDSVLVAGLQSWVAPLIVGMLCTAVLQTCLIALQKQFLLRLETRIALTSAARFFWHVLRLPVGFYHQRSVGDIGSRMGLNYHVAKTLAENLASGVLSIISAVFFALAMMFYDVTMSLVSIAVVLVNFAVLHHVAARRKPLIEQQSINRGKVEGVTMNGLMLMETLKASGAESDFFSRWAGNQARLAQSTQAMSRTMIGLDLLPRSLTALNMALILGLGGYRVMSGEMTIGMLVAFQALVAGFVGPVNVMVALANKIQVFQSDMERLDDVMDSPCEALAEAEAQADFQADAQADILAGPLTADTVKLESAKLSGALALRHVTFGYSLLEPPLLDDFSLTLQPGQRIALVGPSGCGKSTIAKLVTGLYQPWQGQILFDGKTREQLPRRQWMNSIAGVDQDIALFSGSIRDNLTMWDETVAESVMINAARDACIHDVIAARPGAYHGQVFEGGSNFSGGQRQRLEIARALTSNPRLLVLDEATSALDAVSEKMIDANLRRRGCSCLIVAHRLSAIRDCDEIILLEKGKVLERGSHQALMELNAHYARLIANE